MSVQIYLASRSPRRAEILKQLSVRFSVISSDIDESCHPNELPANYVVRLAAEKAAAGLTALTAEGLPSLPILAADTTVAVANTILGKPESDEEAFNMLKNLSGGWHEVHTAIALGTEKGVLSALSTTRVEVAELSESLIYGYIATGEPRDKAGAYGIQGLASTFIKRIEGSYSGVMGLPIYETTQLLRQAGVKLLTSE